MGEAGEVRQGCEVRQGDCLEVLRTLDADSVDAVVTDPPYGLAFMGKDWDHGVPGVAYWREVLRVAKPGAYLLAAGGQRTHHRLMVALEDAGWEIRDVIMHVFGSGFPKSLDVSKAIDNAAGAERGVVGTNRFSKINGACNKNTYGNATRPHETAPATEAAKRWDGWGTALKPAYEPWILARKPLIGAVAANVLRYGTGAMNIDDCRVPANDGVPLFGNGRRESVSAYADGLGCDGRTGEVSTAGRWPANLIHDGSEEVLAGFPQSKGQQGDVRGNEPSHTGDDGTNCYGEYGRVPAAKRGDSGSAARFFYCAKASKEDRDEGCKGLDDKAYGQKHYSSARLNDLRMVGEQARNPNRNHHPTVKPTALMRYLCRLVTPPNGLILDPFMGSGSTGKGAIMEGFRFIGIEQDAKYCEIARRRLAHARANVGVQGELGL